MPFVIRKVYKLSFCYPIQLMHYSHFKTQSLQHLKPIKFKNVFVSIKPLHVSVFFHDHLQKVLHCALCRYYSSRWFAFVEFVLSRSMWPHVYVICVCLVFSSVGDLLVNCCALCRYYSSRWFAFVEFVLLRNMWPHVYVICVCLVFLSVGDLCVWCSCLLVICVFGVLVCWWSASNLILTNTFLTFYWF